MRVAMLLALGLLFSHEKSEAQTGNDSTASGTRNAVSDKAKVLPKQGRAEFVCKIYALGESYMIDKDTFSGSCFLFKWNGNRFILTNSHVVRGREAFIVNFNDGKNKPVVVRLIGTDPAMDIAVFTVDSVAADSLPEPAELGDSDELINCSPFNETTPPCKAYYIESAVPEFPIVQFSGDAGTISNVREITGHYLQTQPRLVRANINTHPGSSGAPLMDSNGKVLGVAMGSMNYIYSLVIPINDVKRVLPEMISGDEIREVKRADIAGLSLAVCLYPRMPTTCNPEHLLVGTISKALNKAGLETGDEIVSIDGVEFRDWTDYKYFLMFEREVGDTVSVRLRRKNKDGTLKELSISVVLGEIRVPDPDKDEDIGQDRNKKRKRFLIF